MNDITPQVAPGPYVTLPLAEAITGLTVKAMERKIQEGVWVEGKEFRYAPDGRIYVSMEGYRQWVERGTGSKRARRASASNSPTKGEQSKNA